MRSRRGGGGFNMIAIDDENESHKSHASPLSSKFDIVIYIFIRYEIK
jgi:hypothetical protein